MTGQQRRRLADAIIAAFPTEPDLARMMRQADFDPPKRLAAITTASGLENQVDELIAAAEAGGWLGHLVHEAWKQQKTNPELNAVHDELKPVVLAAIIDHYRVPLMGERPLIDRESLRDAVKRLADAQKRILVVQGEPLSGKSYTIWFLRYLRDRHGSFSLVWLDLQALAKASTNGLIEPIALARSMVAQMSLGAGLIVERGEQTWAAWTNQFCDDVTGRLSEAAKPWWLVVDNFHNVRLPQESLDFLKKICERATINIPKLQVVLLSYTDTLPDALEPDIDRETIKQIGPEEIGLFFKAVYDAQGLPVTPAAVVADVREVMQAVQPNHPRRLELIASEALKVARKIVSGART